jgi:hypothetical protein
LKRKRRWTRIFRLLQAASMIVVLGTLIAHRDALPLPWKR